MRTVIALLAAGCTAHTVLTATPAATATATATLVTLAVGFLSDSAAALWRGCGRRAAGRFRLQGVGALLGAFRSRAAMMTMVAARTATTMVALVPLLRTRCLRR